MTTPDVSPEPMRLASNARWTEPADGVPLFAKPAWMSAAACRGSDPNDFIPHRGEAAKGARAKAVCGRCPVADECLAHALETGALGIWGGTSTVERQKMRAQRRGGAA